MKIQLQLQCQLTILQKLLTLPHVEQFFLFQLEAILRIQKEKE